MCGRRNHVFGVIMCAQAIKGPTTCTALQAYDYMESKRYELDKARLPTADETL